MPSCAIAEILSETVFILRIYEAYSEEDCVEPLPYKFFTVAVIRDSIVELKGLNFDNGICKEDFKAMLKTAISIAGKPIQLYWNHKKKEHFYPRKPFTLTL